MKKKLFITVASLIAVVLLLLVLITPRPEPDPPLPVPNGYDDFSKAGALMEHNPPDWGSMQGEDLHAALLSLTATNASGLHRVREGLAKECCVVPYGFNSATNGHLNDLAEFKRIALGFAAASKLSLIEGRTNEAAQFALDCIRFGNEAARGGVIIDHFVGMAIKTIGLARLEEALPGTDAATARKLVDALDEVAARRELPAEVFKREAQWARQGRLGPASVFARILLPFQSRKIRASTEVKFKKAADDLQRAKLRAAVHAYEVDHGALPASARDLTPQYLKSVPLDSSTGQELPLP